MMVRLSHTVVTLHHSVIYSTERRTSLETLKFKHKYLNIVEPINISMKMIESHDKYIRNKTCYIATLLQLF